ncbi:MAG: SusC/RagA family TonB-linked outer membrane protein [Dysgonamonadaceae bacterium]|nr:SusC/RagA family TonB-linked outer membrane protein [Dysgonamonadaceae bacterium]
MKLMALLLFCTGIQLSAAVRAQEVTFTFDLKNATFDELMKEIRRNSDYYFVYKDSEVVGVNKLTKHFKSARITEILQECLEDTDLSYSLEDNLIVIKRKGQEAAPARQQQKPAGKISGRVTDESGEPLPGVTVIVKGTTKGVITDVEGNFQLEGLSGNELTLRISYVGMETQELTANVNSNITVRMKDDVNQIGQVVVTGYQKIERRALTSSITTINMNDLQTINQPNIDKLLQGQVAGMTIMSTSGAPGSVPQIRIRGTSTLSGNLQPLWVVDGVILDDPVNSSVDDILNNRNLIASGIGGINVNDIEDINVLKDASATALYGTRAANGVIVITSKKGNAGKTRINYNGGVTVGVRPQLKDGYMMNSKERIAVNMEMIQNGTFSATSSSVGQYGTVSDFERYWIDVQDRKMTYEEFENKVKQLETVNTDWFKYLFRNSVTHRHSLSISGGNEKTTFYLSGSYMDDQATAKEVAQKTYTSTVKVYTRLRDNLRVGGTIDINNRSNESFFAADSRMNPYEWAIYATRAHNVYDENGDYNYMYLNNIKYNYLEDRDKSWRKSNSFGFKGTVDLEWKILPDLDYNMLFSYSKGHTSDEDVAKDDSYFVRSIRNNYYTVVNSTAVYLWKEGGYRKTRSTDNSSLTFRNQLNWRPAFGEHRLDLMAGQEIRTSKYEDETTTIYGYVHDQGRQMLLQTDLIASMGVPYWVMSLNESAALSWYGSAGYTYKNRYTASLNGRVDGSNRFGIKTNKLFNPLWSFGVNYQLKEEDFLKDVDWVSYLTMRASYGSQGNLASQAYSDLVATTGTIDQVKKENYLNITAPKNPNLKWEKNYTKDIALEFGFFKRRLTGVVEYYYKKAVDLLGNKQVSQVSGFSVLQVNWASMMNRGWEATLNAILIDSKSPSGFRWSTSFNMGHNTNEVLDVYTTPTYTDLTNARRTNYASSAVVGKPIDGLWSYRYAGLNSDGRATFYNGQMVTDDDGNETEKTVLYGVRDIDALEYSGTTMPIVQSGWTNTFYFKKFTLSALLVGSFGNVIRLRNLNASSFDFAYPDPLSNMPREFVYRWMQAGDEAYTDIPRLEIDPYDYALSYTTPYNATMYNNSNLRTVKGDYVRLQNLSLSYDWFSEKMRAKGIQNIRLMIQGNNLHAWHTSKLKGQDPEATGALMKYAATNSANVTFGNTFLPLSQSWSFTVNVQF